MATVYAKRGSDPKTARRDAKHAMQKKQMEILDADAKRKSLERSLDEKKQEIARVKLRVEKLQVELLTLERQRSGLDRERVDIEREVSGLARQVRRLEHEAELLREAAYRGERDVGI